MLERLLKRMLSHPQKAGLFFKVRTGVTPLWQAVFTRSTQPRVLARDEKIIIVGLGISSLTFARALRRSGHENVMLVAKEPDFGGKCVHTGCMPSEYFSLHRELSLEEKRLGARQLVHRLRSFAEAAYRELGYPIRMTEAVEVKGKSLILKNGEPLDFNRLVLATGNRSPELKELPSALPISHFWEIPAGNLVIWSDGNPASLSYAEMAHERGIEVTVCFSKPLALEHLPSYRYFEQAIKNRGIRVLHQTGILNSTSNTLHVKSEEGEQTLRFDTLLYDAVPVLNLPAIDGRVPRLGDIDFTTSSLTARSDIFVLGDASGMLSASEAELQANLLARSWTIGEPIDARHFERLPFRLHGSKSLAWVGSPWSLLSDEWRTLDFSALGWSLLQGEKGETGKLWYLFDETKERVEAIHICHAHAAELISLAAVLIDLPTSDPRWACASVHPASSEIFKLIIEDIASRRSRRVLAFPQRDNPAPLALPAKELHLGDVALIHKAESFRSYFTSREQKAGIVDHRPRAYFSILLGVKALLNRLKKDSPELTLTPSAAGSYECPEVPDLVARVDEEKGLAIVAASGRSVQIKLG